MAPVFEAEGVVRPPLARTCSVRNSARVSDLVDEAKDNATDGSETVGRLQNRGEQMAGLSCSFATASRELFLHPAKRCSGAIQFEAEGVVRPPLARTCSVRNSARVSDLVDEAKDNATGRSETVGRLQNRGVQQGAASLRNNRQVSCGVSVREPNERYFLPEPVLPALNGFPEATKSGQEAGLEAKKDMSEKNAKEFDDRFDLSRLPRNHPVLAPNLSWLSDGDAADLEGSDLDASKKDLPKEEASFECAERRRRSAEASTAVPKASTVCKEPVRLKFGQSRDLYQKKKDILNALDATTESFSWWQFSLDFIAHTLPIFLGPFAIPFIYLLFECSYNALVNRSFIPRREIPMSCVFFFMQTFVPITFTASFILNLVWGLESLYEVEYSMVFVLYIVRAVTISIKYAYMPPLLYTRRTYAAPETLDGSENAYIGETMIFGWNRISPRAAALLARMSMAAVAPGLLLKSEMEDEGQHMLFVPWHSRTFFGGAYERSYSFMELCRNLSPKGFAGRRRFIPLTRCLNSHHLDAVVQVVRTVVAACLRPGAKFDFFHELLPYPRTQLDEALQYDEVPSPRGSFRARSRSKGGLKRQEMSEGDLVFARASSSCSFHSASSSYLPKTTGTAGSSETPGDVASVGNLFQYLIGVLMEVEREKEPAILLHIVRFSFALFMTIIPGLSRLHEGHGFFGRQTDGSRGELVTGLLLFVTFFLSWTDVFVFTLAIKDVWRRFMLMKWAGALLSFETEERGSLEPQVALLPVLDMTDPRTVRNWRMLRQLLMNWGNGFSLRTNKFTSVFMLVKGAMQVYLILKIYVKPDTVTLCDLLAITAQSLCFGVLFVASVVYGQLINTQADRHRYLLSMHRLRTMDLIVSSTPSLHRQAGVSTAMMTQSAGDAEGEGESFDCSTGNGGWVDVDGRQRSVADLQSSTRQLFINIETVKMQIQEQAITVLGCQANITLLTSVSAIPIALVSSVQHFCYNTDAGQAVCTWL